LEVVEDAKSLSCEPIEHMRKELGKASHDEYMSEMKLNKPRSRSSTETDSPAAPPVAASLVSDTAAPPVATSLVSDTVQCLGEENLHNLAVTPIKGRGGETLFRMAVMADHDIVSNYIRKNGYWEITHPSELVALFHENMTMPTPTPTSPLTFLDVGGNLGFYSFLFAFYGYDVITIEPMTRNRAAINATMCLNPEMTKNMKVVAAAVGTEETAKLTCQIGLVPWNLGNGILKCAPGLPPCSIEKKNVCEDIASTTIDRIL